MENNVEMILNVAKFCDTFKNEGLDYYMTNEKGKSVFFVFNCQFWNNEQYSKEDLKEMEEKWTSFDYYLHKYTKENGFEEDTNVSEDCGTVKIDSEMKSSGISLNMTSEILDYYTSRNFYFKGYFTFDTILSPIELELLTKLLKK